MYLTVCAVANIFSNIDLSVLRIASLDGMLGIKSSCFRQLNISYIGCTNVYDDTSMTSCLQIIHHPQQKSVIFMKKEARHRITK